MTLKMKKNLTTDREINPRQNANFLSVIFFFYTRKIFKKGIKRGIHEWDIYEILDDCRSEKLGCRIEEEWEKERQKKKSRIPLLACLFRIFGTQYMLWGLIVFIVKTILMVAKPIAIGKVVSYFDSNKPGATTWNEALFYASVLLIAIFCSALFMHNTYFYMHQLVMKLKICICSLIYRKSLKLSARALLKFTSGQAVTLMTKDILCFDIAPQLSHDLWIGTFHVAIMTYLIYKQIGMCAFVGVGFLFLLIPFQALLGRQSSRMRLKTAASTDKRLRFTQEILNAIKIIKVYTWEKIFNRSVADIRKKEVNDLKIVFYIKFLGLSIGHLCAKISLCLCLLLYAALGNRITAEKAFIVLSCFASLRSVLTMHLPLGFAQIAEMMAAVKRITEFLNAEEAGEPFQAISEKGEPSISLEKVSAAVDRNTIILKDITLDFKPGLNIVTGSVGSGKSFLMKLLMNEMTATSGSVKVVGQKSYASQDPWLFPETIRENIVFYKPFDEERYREVIRICALRKDISQFPEKDSTIIIDKGLNLSRGQQARINLARAVYADADIYLLDDALSAVDAHVSTFIFEECIKKFLKDKICILVTHNLQHLKESQQIVVLHEGEIEFVGRYEDMSKETLDELIQEEETDKEDLEVEEAKKKEAEANERDEAYEDNTLLKLSNGLDKAPTSPTAIYQENQQEGKVPWKVYKKYFLFGGGFWIFSVLFLFYIASQATTSWSDTFIREWVNIEPKLGNLEANNLTNTTEYEDLYSQHSWLMNQYIILIVATVVTSIVRFLIYFAYNAKLVLNLHNTILSRILKGRMLFFDKNLSGNILNRFSRDLAIMDENLPFQIQECVRILLTLAGTMVVMATVNWIFIIPSIFLMLYLYILRILYLRTGRSMLRLEGITRSPVVGHVNASMEGLLTIRSNGAQDHMIKVFNTRQNLFFSAAYMVISTSRAFGLIADLTTFFYVAMVIFSFLFITTGAYAGNVGLAITQSFMLTGVLQWGICRWAELETRMTSVERLLEYDSIEMEDDSGEKPEKWPTEGMILFKNVTLKYSKTSDPVLRNINFTIEPKEKIGIVGRTGAGKSSIISVLFKLYKIEGEILIDGKDIGKIANEALRSSISIIPQDPVLFSGSLRNNLDPKKQNTDKEIWDALEEVEMKKMVNTFEAGLETDLPEGGSIFSIGQRQLICLARAILRKNKILVLDEATANVDPQTDALIQRTVRKKFKDCTVLTIAHRLNNVMDCDKVMVVSAGQIIEFDDPKILKTNSESNFYKMVKQAGLV